MLDLTSKDEHLKICRTGFKLKLHQHFLPFHLTWMVNIVVLMAVMVDSTAIYWPAIAFLFLVFDFLCDGFVAGRRRFLVVCTNKAAGVCEITGSGFHAGCCLLNAPSLMLPVPSKSSNLSCEKAASPQDKDESTQRCDTQEWN